MHPLGALHWNGAFSAARRQWKLSRAITRGATYINQDELQIRRVYLHGGSVHQKARPRLGALTLLLFNSQRNSAGGMSSPAVSDANADHQSAPRPEYLNLKKGFTWMSKSLHRCKPRRCLARVRLVEDVAVYRHVDDYLAVFNLQAVLTDYVAQTGIVPFV